MKYFIVTGAYGGMGRKTVKLLKEQGFAVFALDKRVEEEEENVFPIQIDVTDEKSVFSAVDKVKNITDSIYGIIHYAGVYMLDSLIEIPVEKLKAIVNVNFLGAAIVNRAFASMLAGNGRILHITSELAPLYPLPFTGIYAVTKTALDRYAYSLRMEMQLLGVHVSVLRAGAVETDMLGASTTALDAFCKKTEHYTFNADKFRRIVNKVEARCITTDKLAKRAVGIVTKKRPKFAYSINRNPLLLLLSILPKRMQLCVIKKVLK